jgi:RNA helicase./Putative viral replication protein.
MAAEAGMSREQLNMRMRNVVFTFNNYKQEEYELLLLKLQQKTTYYVAGKEVGDGGTPHIQGYFDMKNEMTRSAIFKYFKPLTFFFDKRMGTSEQAISYCKKDNNFVEWGEPNKVKKVGERSDIDEVRQMVSENNGMREIVQKARNYQCLRMAEIILKYNENVRMWKPDVYWLFGDTGAGKTRKAFEIFSDRSKVWVSNKTLKWWEGYDAHPDVLFDEFRGDFATFHEMLRILDQYPYRVEHKGGSRQLLARRIIITSCHPPSEVYNGVTNEDKLQLFRRIDKVIKFVKDEAGYADYETNHEGLSLNIVNIDNELMMI